MIFIWRCLKYIVHNQKKRFIKKTIFYFICINWFFFKNAYNIVIFYYMLRRKICFLHPSCTNPPPQKKLFLMCFSLSLCLSAICYVACLFCIDYLFPVCCLSVYTLSTVCLLFCCCLLSVCYLLCIYKLWVSFPVQSLCYLSVSSLPSKCLLSVCILSDVCILPNCKLSLCIYLLSANFLFILRLHFHIG